MADRYGRGPGQVSLDGGYASQEDIEALTIPRPGAAATLIHMPPPREKPEEQLTPEASGERQRKRERGTKGGLAYSGTGPVVPQRCSRRGMSP